MEFLEWYNLFRRANKLSPDPYDLRHQYDYNAAFESGVSSSKGHLPSAFKGIGHPRRFLEGIDTATGKPAKLGARIKNIQLQLLIEELFRRNNDRSPKNR